MSASFAGELVRNWKESLPLSFDELHIIPDINGEYRFSLSVSFHGVKIAHGGIAKDLAGVFPKVSKWQKDLIAEICDIQFCSSGEG